MQAWPSAGRYLVDIHLITRPHRPDCAQVVRWESLGAAKSVVDRDGRGKHRRCCCASVL